MNREVYAWFCENLEEWFSRAIYSTRWGDEVVGLCPIAVGRVKSVPANVAVPIERGGRYA